MLPELRANAAHAQALSDPRPVPANISVVMTADDALPICVDVLKMPFNWAPPETSKSELYKKHRSFKSHVELLGPDGLVTSNVVRLGLYGMQPTSEYGVRTHPAADIYIMLAGACFCMRGDAADHSSGGGDRSHHASC